MGEAGASAPDVDVVVVGAGIGGIYAVHRLTSDGLLVQGFEGAPGVGGVWYHNRYPGARVDVESTVYCYFDEEIYREWEWTERYPSQPELEAYLNFAADKWDVKRHFRFSTWVTGATWIPEHDWYEVTTDDGGRLTTRFIVMATGQLSESRPPSFPGLEDYQGEWVLTSHWPDRPVALEGRRIGVVGTGSSGVQVVTAVAEVAEEVVVFQRTANYSVPAHNRPIDPTVLAAYRADVPGALARLMSQKAGMDIDMPEFSALELDEAGRQEQLERRWAHGGHAMGLVFTDQGLSLDANFHVAEFVRDKIRGTVKDPEVAELVMPHRYPIGSRRLVVDTGYYEALNKAHVHVVDVREDPIERITPTGLRTRNGQEFELDLLIFALGFNAFNGALDKARIRNERGQGYTDGWARGPRTFLGLMTTGFPNIFVMTGPGSPSVLANMVLGNIYHSDFIADLIAFMREHEYTRVEPTQDAQDAWTAHVAEVAAPTIRRTVENYMVHVNEDDGSRIFIPYVGGLDRYVAACTAVADGGYAELDFQ